MPDGGAVNLATAIATESERRGILQGEAAALFGVSQQTFSRWMRGQAVPSAEHLPAIADFLDVPLEQVERLHAAEVGRRARGRRNNTQRIGELEDRARAISETLAAMQPVLEEALRRLEEIEQRDPPPGV